MVRVHRLFQDNFKPPSDEKANHKKAEVIDMAGIEEKKLRSWMKGAAREAVKEELDSRRGDLTDNEHYLHHLHVADQIRKHKHLTTIVKETFVRWGTLSAIAAFIYGAVEIIKLKTGA